MIKKNKKKWKRFSLLNEYEESWKYIKESKKFIYIMILSLQSNRILRSYSNKNNLD